MTTQSSQVRRVGRRAYTLIELVVAAFLMSLLSMLLIMAWKTFGVPALEVEERARVTVQANLAAESLARDLGGYQVRQEGKSGPNDSNLVYRLYQFESRIDPDANHAYPLRLSFKREDQTSNPATLTISYYVTTSANTLVRIEEESSTSSIVATHIRNLEVVPVDQTHFQISFTVLYQTFQANHTLNVDYPA
jgi:type II secretory pathway pseudopilin PulG